MTWVKLDDQFFAHRKVIDLSKDAKLLHLAAIAHCSAQLTDGELTPGALRAVCALVDVSRDVARELVEAGLWEAHQSGYAIHDYLDYQPSAAKVKAERAATAQRQADFRERHKPTVTDRHAPSNGVTNAARNGVTNTRPVPDPIPRIDPTPDPDLSSPPIAIQEREIAAAASDDAPPRTLALVKPARETTQRTAPAPQRPVAVPPLPKPRAASAARASPHPVAPAAPAPRAPNPLWDALVTLFDYEPQTRTERSNWGGCVKQLRELDATTDDIARRGAAWPKLYGADCAFTVNALIKHWAPLGKIAAPTTTNGANGHGTPQASFGANGTPISDAEYAEIIRRHDILTGTSGGQAPAVVVSGGGGKPAAG